jgi:LacI family transcriptional regulator
MINFVVSDYTFVNQMTGLKKVKMNKRRVTIRSIAEMADVSRMTVLRVLQKRPDVSSETRQRVLEIVERLGYQPNPAIHEDSATRILELITPDIVTPYVNEIIRGVSIAAHQLRYGLVLISEVATAYDRSGFNNISTDGALLIFPNGHEKIIEQLKADGVPYVIIDPRTTTYEDDPTIKTTNRKGIMDAMRYLLALGHRRIAFIAGNLDLSASHERLQGYRDGLAEVGLPFEPDLVFQGNYTQPGGFQQAQAAFKLPQRPTAIIASNDLMAFGAMDAAKFHGLTIAQDISIVGFDDIFQASQTYPPLTTVRQPSEQMGQNGVDLLVTLIERSSALSIKRELPTELIIRKTTGHANQA